MSDNKYKEILISVWMTGALIFLIILLASTAYRVGEKNGQREVQERQSLDYANQVIVNSSVKYRGCENKEEGYADIKFGQGNISVECMCERKVGDK